MNAKLEPLPLPKFKAVLKDLIALVPPDAKWQDYSVALEAASKQLEQERKPKVNLSAYTR